MSSAYSKPQNMTALAHRLAELGYHPVPIQAGRKGPTFANWQNYESTPENINRDFPPLGILIGVKHDNLGAVDIDVYCPELAEKLRAEWISRFPQTLERVGQAPKTAFVFRLPDEPYTVRNTEKRKKGDLEAQVEIRTKTGQIVAYGKHPTTNAPYRWPRGDLWKTPLSSLRMVAEWEAQEYRDWADQQIKQWAGDDDQQDELPQPIAFKIDLGSYVGLNDGPPKEGAIKEALSYISPDLPHDQWVEVLMALHDYYGGSAAGLAAAQDWSSPYPNYNAREVEAKWKSFRGAGVSYSTIFHYAKQGGADLAEIGRKHPKPLKIPAPQQDVTAPTEITNQVEAGDWQDELIRNSRGRALWNTANALRIMEHDPNLKNCFAFDEFRQIKMLTAPIPFSGERSNAFQGREIKDSDITKLVSYFNRIGFPDATKTVAADVVEAVSEASTYHPVRNYLNQLPQWDGVPRANSWLLDYCAVTPRDDDEARYVQEAGKRWLISAVARAMKPGCKADGVLILEGRQGAMKSTTLRTLAGGEWFGDSLPSMHTKDASDYLRGKWIIEMAELSNINKAEVEVVKAFIAREEERFRPAYARNEITYARQCVFAGSTNKSDYLRDETGNRRFWPVKVGTSCDVRSLARDRDQIWAEVVNMFRAGEIWWFDGMVAKVAEKQQAERVSQDAWEAEVLNYLIGKVEVSCTAIAKNALDIEVSKIDRLVTNRISAILTSNGWSRSGKFSSGADKDRARFVRDEAAE